jgi:hypothetical protein
MRRILFLLGLMAAASSVAVSQSLPNRSIPPSAPSTTSTIEPPRLPLPSVQCRGADLSVRQVSDDAAMGGEHLILYAWRNNSSMPCTLKGYPRYELLDKLGAVRPRGRAINSQQLPVDEEKMRPQLVTIKPAQETWFRVHYNSGGAGYIGKPCPVSRKVRIVAPGTTRAFILKENITSCRTVEVSTVRPEPMPE